MASEISWVVQLTTSGQAAPRTAEDANSEEDAGEEEGDVGHPKLEPKSARQTTNPSRARGPSFPTSGTSVPAYDTKRTVYSAADPQRLRVGELTHDRAGQGHREGLAIPIRCHESRQ